MSDNRKSGKKEEEAPRRHYRQADEGIDNSTIISPAKSRSSGKSKRASRHPSEVASLQADSLEDLRNGTDPRRLDPQGTKESGTKSTSTTKASLSRAEQDASAKNRSRRTRPSTAAPGVVMEPRTPASSVDATGLDRLEQDAMAKANASLSRPRAVAAVGGNQSGKSSGRSANESATARRTASTISESSTTSGVGAVPSSTGSQQGKPSGRSPAQSQAATATSIADQRSFSLRSMEADIIAKDRARPSTAATSSGVASVVAVTTVPVTNRGEVTTTPTSAPHTLANMRRIEADVMSKQPAPIPVAPYRSAPRQSARPVAMGVADDGFGDATVYQPQHESRTAEPITDPTTTDSITIAPTTVTTTVAHWEPPAPTDAMVVMDESPHTYAPMIPYDAGQADGGIVAFVANQVLDATGVAVVMSEEEEEKLELKKHRRHVIYGVMSSILVIIIVAVILVVFIGGSKTPIARVPTSSPSEFPTMTPSSSPTTGRLEEIITMLSNKSGAEALANISSPQFLAATWVSDSDLLQLPLDSAQLLQRYFLATFYFAMDGDKWVQCSQKDRICGGDSKYKSWLIDKESECNWLGIECDVNEDVVEIFFQRSSGNNLRGTLPLELSFLTNIKSLFLANNFISGTIPLFLEKLTKLTSLFLLGNKFNGPLSENIFQELQQLNVLRLNDNALTGPIPTSLSALPLTDLNLKNNLLTGRIPGSIGYLTALSTLKYCVQL